MQLALEVVCSNVCLKLLGGNSVERAGEEEVVAGLGWSTVAEAGGMYTSLVVQGFILLALQPVLVLRLSQ